MPLRSYDEVRPWAKSIAKQVSLREMPPWFAHPDSRPMKGDQNLRQEEIDAIVAWAESGAAEGDPADLPPPRDCDLQRRLGPPQADLERGPGASMVGKKSTTVPLLSREARPRATCG
jgi:hypothetical protein